MAGHPYRPRLAALTACLVLGVACSGSGGSQEPKPPVVSNSIGPEGGRVDLEGMIVSVPEGALTSQVKIQIAVVDHGAAEIPGRIRVSKIYRVTPESLTFLVPITIVLPYDPALLPTGIRDESVDGRKVDVNREPDSLALPQVDSARRTVRGDTSSLGIFWATAPAGALASSLRISPVLSSIAVGDKATFAAAARDQYDEALPPDGVVWTISDETVATLVDNADGTAEATALAAGIVEVRATFEALSATATLTVSAEQPFPTHVSWENPRPFGNRLVALTGDADKVYAAGTIGTLLSWGPSGFEAWSGSRELALSQLATGPMGLFGVGVRGQVRVFAKLEFAEGAYSVAAELSLQRISTALAILQRETEVYAAGDGGDLVIYDASGFRTEPLPTLETILAIGEREGDALIVGAGGAVYAGDSAGWTSLNPGGSLYLVSAVVLQGHVYALSPTKLLSLEPTGWVEVDVPSSTGLVTKERLEVVGAGLAVFGKAAGAVPTEAVFDGIEWTSRPLPTDVVATWGRAPDELFATTKSGAFLRSDFMDGIEYFAELREGPSWNLGKLLVFDGGQVVAPATFCSDASCTDPVTRLFIRDAQGASTLGMQAFPGLAIGLVGDAADDLWVASNSNSGSLIHWNGSTWDSTLPIPGISSVVRCGGTLIAGTKGGLVRQEGDVFVPIPTDPEALAQFGNVSGVACAADAVFVAGSAGYLARIDPDGTTLTIDPKEYGYQKKTWRTVWATDKKQAFFGGVSASIYFWDGTKLSAFYRPGNIDVKSVRALWGTDYGDVWAAGDRVDGTSFLAHFDGGVWVAVDALSDASLADVKPGAEGELWVGGDRGTLLRVTLE